MLTRALQFENNPSKDKQLTFADAHQHLSDTWDQMRLTSLEHSNTSGRLGEPTKELNFADHDPYTTHPVIRSLPNGNAIRPGADNSQPQGKSAFSSFESLDLDLNLKPGQSKGQSVFSSFESLDLDLNLKPGK